MRKQIELQQKKMKQEEEALNRRIMLYQMIDNVQSQELKEMFTEKFQRDNKDKRLRLHRMDYPNLPIIPNYAKFTSLPQFRYVDKDNLEDWLKKKREEENAQKFVKKKDQGKKVMKKVDPRDKILEQYSHPLEQRKYKKATEQLADRHIFNHLKNRMGEDLTKKVKELNRKMREKNKY